jgi:Flp pilus assembly secretin CpaC
MLTALRACAVLLTLLMPLSCAHAAAGDMVTVNVNMARILRIGAAAATVVIGNPGVADVTIQDPTTLVLTGKSYGRTNLIVLGSDGDPIVDTVIEVVQSRDDLVTLYVGAMRTSLSCSPICQPTISLGDGQSFTSDSVASQGLVESANR